MNMKKTMAAIAAGAVAVSAMATTVSAVEDQTLNYNFKKAIKEEKSGTVNVTLVIDNQAIDDGTVAFGIDTKFDVNSITVKVEDNTGAIPTKTLVGVVDKGSENYDPSVAANDALVATVGEGKDLKAVGDAKITITANVNHKLASWAGLSDFNTSAIDWWNVSNMYYDPDTATDDDEITSRNFKASGFTSTKDEYIYSPLKTTLKNNENILTYLTTNNVNGNDKKYVNVGPVINDAIENYESVVFKFNTVTGEYVRFAATDANGARIANEASAEKLEATVAAKISAANKDLGLAEAAEIVAKAAVEEAGGAGADEDADALLAEAQALVADCKAEVEKWEKSGRLWFTTPNSWEGSDYTKFTQHLYNGMVADDYFAGENTGYLGLDWAGYNLFQGALVINENLTMSLADTAMFDWQETSVSFDWDAIADASQTNNAYAMYIQSLELATSVDWYWASMDVILTAGAVDDATSDAEAKADDETLDEEVIEDEVIEEEIVEEEIVEDEEVEEEVEEEVVEEEVEEEVEVSNPTTGNASVALAVIPVALAAAAVVAKKRN